MIRVKVKRNDTNEVINQGEFETQQAAEAWVQAQEAKEKCSFKRFGEYTVSYQDITQEKQDIETKKQAREAAKLVAKDAKKALQAVKDADNLNKLQKATEDLAKVVHALVKVLDLTDPTEASIL